MRHTGQTKKVGTFLYTL